MLTHEEYVAMGYCPAMINLNPPKNGIRIGGRKRIPRITWCILKANHRSPQHCTLDLAPTIHAEYVYWTDDHPGAIDPTVPKGQTVT